ncbi:MAG: putative DNA binding domain-containing protein [candidate division KSB1 bacterium]|nr:putative DNA binding domain-containing protein [candidate division KSB1 bacterium]MDZ7364764.1 putative DNA binding domain-containing protein [candidate division KSB1 bacterium]MDZ7402488.1 putative DNA binding domain-containing protein [candidate division KSB1 bacterium]
MDCKELLDILNRGEDSAHQFKENFTSIDNLAVEISAFANTDGGQIIIGVSDRGALLGLSQEDIHRLNQWISNATTSKIDKAIYVKTEILACEGRRLMIIHVPRGSNKPYAVNRVDVWVKNGADKRRAPIEEVLRLAQTSGLHFADELEIDAGMEDFDKEFFLRRYKKYYKEGFEKLGISLEQLLTNLKILKNDKLTLAGLLLFGKNPERLRPQFVTKATYFAGKDVSVRDFIDKQDVHGKLIEQFKEGRAFIKRNLRRIQTTKNFNAPGVLEIPEEAFAEAIANAIVHRNYYISAPIQIYLFDDRLEIHSPGNLPNTITEQNIKFGVHVERNPTILSFLEKDAEFSYTGRGSGIPRVIKACNRAKVKVDFIDDQVKQVFSVVFFRRT